MTSARHQVDSTVKEMDQKLGVSEKVNSIDKEYKISEKATAATAAVSAKAAEIDGEYRISEKTNAAVQAAKAKASELDEKHHISEQAAAGAAIVAEKASAAGAVVAGKARCAVLNSRDDVSGLTRVPCRLLIGKPKNNEDDNEGVELVRDVQAEAVEVGVKVRWFWCVWRRCAT